MKNLTKHVGLFALLLIASVARAQEISMKWGLENKWSYQETTRTLNDDASVHSNRGSRKYQTFSFNNNSAVVDTMLKCFERHFELWSKFTRTWSGGDPSKSKRQAFEEFKSVQDPLCDQHAKQQAPVLYFDFVSKSKDEFILEAIEITTLRFSEYKGGGFSKEEAWYDVILSHAQGKKRYDVSKRLAFTGTGRSELRFWSDNYYAEQGWIAPMGEYLIDIKFIFSCAGKQTTVRTGPFKIDV